MAWRDMGCLRGISLLNLVFKLKFLDVFMGREDPIEFDIFLSFVLVFVLVLLSWLSVLLGWWEG